MFLSTIEDYVFKYYKHITVALCFVAIAVWLTFFIAWGIRLDLFALISN